MSCGHHTCATLNATPNLYAGVAAAVLHTSVHAHPNMAVGLENAGRYANKWNVCAGGADDSEINMYTGAVCYLDALRRELREEFKLDSSWASFDAIFKRGGAYDYIIVGGTPVFIGFMPAGVHRATIRNRMQHAMANPATYPYAEREMRDIEYCNLGTRRTPEGRTLVLSSFASSIIDRLVQRF